MPTPQARRRFEQSLEIALRLAKASPTSAQAQRDLGTSLVLRSKSNDCNKNVSVLLLFIRESVDLMRQLENHSRRKGLYAE